MDPTTTEDKIILSGDSCSPPWFFALFVLDEAGGETAEFAKLVVVVEGDDVLLVLFLFTWE